jgi:hypothetical protein
VDLKKNQFQNYYMNPKTPLIFGKALNFCTKTHIDEPIIVNLLMVVQNTIESLFYFNLTPKIPCVLLTNL